MLIISTFDTPVGKLKVAYDEHYIYQSFFTDSSATDNTDSYLADNIRTALDLWFSDCHYRFQLPLKPQGTPFQLSVWNALMVIPVGRVISYGELAKTLQSSPRAIGQACKKNPLALFIPCHRVVGKANLGGYMGSVEKATYKASLLAHEGYTHL